MVSRLHNLLRCCWRWLRSWFTRRLAAPTPVRVAPVTPSPDPDDDVPTIRFTPVAPARTTFAPVAPPPPSVPQPPAPSVWVEPATREQLAEGLFRFLASLALGKPQAPRPLLVEAATLQGFLEQPPAELAEALRCCVDRFLIELSPDATLGKEADLSPAVWVVALALHNCLTPPPGGVKPAEDPVETFVPALVDTLPPARTLGELLAWHALLDSTVALLSRLSPGRGRALTGLIHRSPLTAMANPQLFLSPLLLPLAGELLRGWEGRSEDVKPWRDVDDWLGCVGILLERRPVASWLRQRWLALAEPRELCRNVGLLLEALRRRGMQRRFLLEFYEAFDYFKAEGVGKGETATRRWPLVERMEKLLRAPGESEAAIRLNRWGNEYLMLFRPLLEIVIEEDGLPRDMSLLSRELLQALRPLLDLMTERAGQQGQVGDIEFESDESN